MPSEADGWARPPEAIQASPSPAALAARVGPFRWFVLWTAILVLGPLAALEGAGAGFAVAVAVALGIAGTALTLARVRSIAGAPRLPATDPLPPSEARWRWVAIALVAIADLALAAVLSIGRLAGPWTSVAGSGPVGPLVAPVFVLTVATEVALLGALADRSLPDRLRVLVLAQAALLALSPTAVAGAPARLLLAVVGAALVVAMIVLALQFLYRHKQLEERNLALLVAWPFAAGVTSAGWFLWAFERSPYVLAVSIPIQLAVALAWTVGSPLRPAGARVPWLLRPFAIFEFLLCAFLAEFFLGALLDLSLTGPSFLQFIPFVPVTGPALTSVGIALYNGLWFGAAIMASAWFLVVLGFTMGPLVALKIRETHEPAQKYRLGLTIAAFALAAIYIPSAASSTPLVNASWLASVPIIGWGFGLRSGGPFESGIFLAVILMYVSVGVLTVLFGRKAICSVLCGAALMYQGTAMSEMRGFNQSSRVGKYFLGSQLSTAYVVTSGVALVSLFAVSLLSVLRWIPAVQVANGDLDVAALPLPIELYFGGVWFAMFVTTPFIGTYNCATTGFCHWGALSIPFAKVGLFRLKVKDKKVCQECTTFDCAKACPVGLVDMPLYFRTKGEYRSTKCCGVGDCVGACPYGNMYHQDVRFWVLRRLRRSDPHAPPVPGGGTPLPMVRSTAGPAAAPPVRAQADTADRTPA